MNSVRDLFGKNPINPANDVDGQVFDTDQDDMEAHIPGTVFNKRQARMLKIAVIVMGLMLVAGFALLVAIIAYRAMQAPVRKAPVAPASVQVPLSGSATAPSTAKPQARAARPATAQNLRNIEGLIPAGSKLLDSKMDAARLILTLQAPNGDLQLIMLDLKSWRITGSALLKQKK